jgi:23S rRNA (uracil1939-C5)-methyltransferase
MSAESQLLFKQERLRREFEACPPFEWLPPVSDYVYNYRSKARLGAKLVEKKGRVLVGFREKMKPYIADIDVCHVLQEPVSTLIQPLERLITSLNDPRSVPQIEVAIGDTASALVFRHLEPFQDKELDLFKSFGRDFDVDVYLQPGNAQSVYKLFPKDGIERLDYQLPEHDCRISFHPLDFTQVNPRVNRKMVNLTLDLLEVNENDRVLDAFCGIGNFSLPLARKVNSVLGLENALPSVERARENAIQNRIENARFEVVDLFMQENLLDDLDSINKVLVDPPRTGALELCKKLATSKVERVVYVSCNPRTLARDAQILVENGYQLRQLGIIDMFPHTTHVESIALLVR